MSDAAHNSFDKTLQHLKGMVREGKAHVSIAFGVASAAKADPVIADVAPTFWGMTIHAHLDRAQLLASKLFDKQNNAMTIERLLATAEKYKNECPHATPDEVQAILDTARVEMNSLAGPLRPIRAKRNRILAHSDPTIVSDPEMLEEQVKVSWSDLNRIFRVGGQILNEVSRAFQNVTSSMEILGTEDYQMVIDLVADAKHAQVDDYEKESGEPCPFPRPQTPGTKRR